MPRKTQAPLPALVAILLMGFLFVSHRLDHVPLWADEGWTIGATDESNPVVTVRDWVVTDVHPPLFFIGLDVWRLFTGDTIFELRYYSVLVTLVGVALAFRLGKAVYSTRAGLFTALFYSLHDLVKVLTQEVRHYVQQMALVTLVMWLYWRFWQRPTRRRGIFFALSGAALLYTHYWGGFVLLGLAVHAAITRRAALRPFLLAFGGIGLLFAPWLPVLAHQITLERPGGLPHALENSWDVYPTLIYQLVGVPELFWVMLCLAGLAGTFALVPSRWRPTPASLLPLPVIALTPALSILINTTYPTLSFRSLAVIIPALCLLAAHGLSRFRQPEQAVIASFILLYSLSITSARPLPRPPWPETADYLAAHTTAQDVILLELDSDSDPMAYYLRQAGGDLVYAFSEYSRERHPDDFGTYLNETLSGRGGVWVAQFDWEASKDIRPELYLRGYVMTAPPVTYHPDGFRAVPPGDVPYRYSDGRPIQLWRLDRPPTNAPIATYGEQVRLLRADFTARPGGVVVNLLWSPVDAPARDFTVSVFLLGANGALTNHDSAPLNGLSPTSAWQAGGVYFDSHFISALPGEYQIGVVVYFFTDSTFTQIENLPASDCTFTPDCRYVIVGTAQVE